MNKSNIVGYILLEEASEPMDSKVVGTTDENKPIAEGILQDADAQNRNGRCYHKSDLKSEIEAPRQKELLESGNMKGENGHPMNKELSRQQTIDPDMVCVKYLKIWMEGDLVKARFTGTNNQRGRDFDADLLCGEKPSFSLRALGTIEEKGGKAWVENLKVITWDRVIYPSHAKAYTKGLITESAGLQPTFESVDVSSLSPNRREIFNGSKGNVIPFDTSGVINFIMQESTNLAIVMNNFDVFYESIEVSNDGRKLQMVDKSGNVIVTNLESFVRNQIMDYVGTKY